MKSLKVKKFISRTLFVLSISTANVYCVRGFPEFKPGEQMILDGMKGKIAMAYSKYGYAPLETAAVELIETLEAKGIDGKEVYGLRRLNTVDEEDDGTTKLALRFDQTVPLARYVAENKGSLVFPFRRQAIGKVWRGERASAGRFREFYQCDVDIIGRGTLNILHDAEPPAIIHEVFESLGIGDFVVRLNNRKILQGLFQYVGVTDPKTIKRAIKVVDNMEKVTAAETIAALQILEITAENADLLMHILRAEESNEKILERLDTMKFNTQFTEGVGELQAVYRGVINLGVPEARLRLDMGIARGLDYYTGTVYETMLTGFPELGSVCSGGRYDNLAETYGDEKFPGVGISIGLTRLFSNLLERGVVKPIATSPARVLVTSQDKAFLGNYQAIAKILRDAGIETEMYYEDGRLSKQLTFAGKKGVPFVIIASGSELGERTVNVKDMRSGAQESVAIEGLLPYFLAKLA